MAANKIRAATLNKCATNNYADDSKASGYVVPNKLWLGF